MAVAEAGYSALAFQFRSLHYSNIATELMCRIDKIRYMQMSHQSLGIRTE